MGLLGELVALGLLIWLAYRAWSILLLAPAAAILAAALAGEPLLAHWTQTHGERGPVRHAVLSTPRRVCSAS